MADSRDITGKNRKFKGTSGIVLPKGTQAERADTEGGEIRFNTDTNLAEYYDGTEWKPIDAPPTITAVSPSSPVDDGSTVTEITITGSNLQSGGTLTIIGNDTTSYSVASFTRVSSSSITFNYTSALAAAGVNTPYDIKYENPSGLAATFEDGFTPNTGPVWVSPAASSSLGSIDIGANASTLTQISVTDTSGGTLVYSISAGALPSGATINSATGAISGVVDTAETATFTIQVTDGSTAITRSFSATVVNPFISATGGTVTTSGDYKIHSFTGDGSFVVSNAGTPGGSNTVDYLVVAGGGGGGAAAPGSSGSGGSGAGGFRESGGTASGCYSVSPLGSSVPALPVSATTYPITVGSGGSAGTPADPLPNPVVRGTPGNNSVFSTITSAGGGRSGAACGPDSAPGGPSGQPGGSGGGTSNYSGSPGATAGTGNTPPVSPPQGTPGGVNGAAGGNYPTGGGGGATQAGDSPNGGSSTDTSRGNGGNGATTSISGSPTTYSGGGGGSLYNTPAQPSGGTGGGGGGGNSPAPNQRPGQPGTANRGGGGGGGVQAQPGGTGGSGIVIIRYKFQ